MKIGLSGRIAKAFINSKITPLLVLAALLMGVLAVLNTPREEEPQISVPMIDIFVPYPGATAKDVEDRVTKVLEKKLWKIKGVEYIYSTSQPGQALITLRYYVGTDLNDAVVRTYNEVMSNMDEVPPGVGQPLVKPMTIDDVPIVSVTLWSNKLNDYDLRRITAVVADEVNRVENVAKVQVIGGRERQVRVEVDPTRLAAYGISPLTLERTLQSGNQSLDAGQFAEANKQFKVKAGTYLVDPEQVKNLVVGVYEQRPVFLKDVATVTDGPSEVNQYVLFGTGPRAADKGVTEPPGRIFPAVTISVSKKPGTNAVWVANDVIKKVDDLKGKVIPSDVQVTVTRDYGETAMEKANELIDHLLIATASVILLIGVVLGIREAIVVGIAVPVTLALALFLSYMHGYTLNRVTLFALIFAIGILVDDAIVVVENMHRWFRMRTLKPLDAAVHSVDEVGNPTILATFTVIAVLIPMAFVRGLMGPYMAPIPINASIAMFFSLLVAFIVTPWFGLRLLKRDEPKAVPAAAGVGGGGEGTVAVGPASSPGGVPGVGMSTGGESEDGPGAEGGRSGNEDHVGNGDHVGEEHGGRVSRMYAGVLMAMVHSRKKRNLFFLAVVLLLFASLILFYTKAVAMKMLPFDNKSEFQVVIDMPRGTTLEQTAAATKAIGDYLSTVNEVTDYEMYIGTASPFNFNGLVRHYYLRQGPDVADIQVNLVAKGERQQQSHDIAKRIRPAVQAIGEKYGANVKVVEVPPGPPVQDTLVLEVYSNDPADQYAAVQQAAEIFKKTPGVVDVDTSLQAPQTQYSFTLTDQARLNGITDQEVAQTLQMMLAGAQVGLVHPPHELEPVKIWLQPPRDRRSSLDELKSIQVPTPSGKLIPLGEVANIQQETAEQTLYRKNLQSVAYVFGDVAGYEESPAYDIAKMWNAVSQIHVPSGAKVEQYLTHQPWLENGVKVKWDGEWQITYEVFRDLGLAFGVALVVMYLLVVAWFQSFITPLVIMAPIPLTMIGVVPGHWLFGAFFTATSMIGVIALAGIIVRNSILLVEFAERRRKEGEDLDAAVVTAGVVRSKPILLTAAAVVVGAFVILFDPIFQGLAISLMFGTIASTVLTLFVIPVLYYAVEIRRAKARMRKEAKARARANA
ncbi:efflux RND transporter permease subunit [Kyrpidia sp.]|uniref:efflux RND transporter permease subunit n=1 Tax=Kyrpidia sp. TaxID=2073077 RepID=UPI002590F1D0|nr:efflux RND transporter permease subunit [Kyrpidia sp.]MCL6577528.1 efflux RND transporter permease subunit [Kyrpidia sp.]